MNVFKVLCSKGAKFVILAENSQNNQFWAHVLIAEHAFLIIEKTISQEY